MGVIDPGQGLFSGNIVLAQPFDSLETLGVLNDNKMVIFQTLDTAANFPYSPFSESGECLFSRSIRGPKTGSRPQ